MATTWVTWTAKPGGAGETMPRSTVAHAAPTGNVNDARLGSYPLACGRWAPDGWDAVISAAPHARRCKRCLKALAKESV